MSLLTRPGDPGAPRTRSSTASPKAPAAPLAPVTAPSVVTQRAAPSPSPVEAPEVRRQLRGAHSRDRYAVVGAGLAGLAVTSLVYLALAPFSGPLGYVLLAWVTTMAFYAVLAWLDGNGSFVADKLVTFLVHSVGLLMLLALAVVVFYTMFNGREAMSYANFYVQDMSLAGPLDPLSVGGIIHGAIGTLIMITIVVVIVVPVGITCAVFLSETRGPFPRFVRTIVEAMTALPSVVAGLFVYAGIITLQATFGVGEKSGLAASIALSVMALPIVIRAADVVLRLVPGTLKEAAAATGAPRWRVAWHVTLPTARSGLMTATILGMARAIGETSPVLLVAGLTNSVNLDPTSGSMMSLPLLTFSLTRSPEPAFISRGFGAATVLMLLVLVLFVLARILGGRGAGELSRRQARRRDRLSARDARRFTRGEAGAAMAQAAIAPASPADRPGGP